MTIRSPAHSFGVRSAVHGLMSASETPAAGAAGLILPGRKTRAAADGRLTARTTSARRPSADGHPPAEGAFKTNKKHKFKGKQDMSEETKATHDGGHAINCAWNRGGYCLIRKGDCDCVCGGDCSDRVAKMARKGKQRRAHTFHGGFLRHEILQSPKARMRRLTYGIDRGVIYSQCTSKKRYPTEYRANEIRRLCMRSRKQELRVYHCRWCDGYHLTSKVNHSDGMMKVA